METSRVQQKLGGGSFDMQRSRNKGSTQHLRIGAGPKFPC